MRPDRPRTLFEALTRCDLFVALVTPTWWCDPGCQQQLDLAQQHRHADPAARRPWHPRPRRLLAGLCRCAGRSQSGYRRRYGAGGDLVRGTAIIVRREAHPQALGNYHAPERKAK